MTPLGYTIVWSAIPVAVLLLGAAVSAYWLAHKRPFPTEPSHVRVARAYLAAKNQAARDVPADPAEGAAQHAFAGTPAGGRPSPAAERSAGR